MKGTQVGCLWLIAHAALASSALGLGNALPCSAVVGLLRVNKPRSGRPEGTKEGGRNLLLRKEVGFLPYGGYELSAADFIRQDPSLRRNESSAGRKDQKLIAERFDEAKVAGELGKGAPWRELPAYAGVRPNRHEP